MTDRPVPADSSLPADSSAAATSPASSVASAAAVPAVPVVSSGPFVPPADAERHARLLASYAARPPIHRDRCFPGAVAVLQIVTLVLVAVPIAGHRPVASTSPAELAGSGVRVRFETQEMRPEAKLPEPAPPTQPTVPDLVEPDAAIAPVPEPPAEEPSPSTETPRRVYGVRRILAKGIGVGGAGDPALVAKQGNTVDGRADSLVATPADLAGSPRTAASVDRAPIPLQRPKPAYSEALRRAHAEGTVTARLLVDAAGTVDSVVVIADIGHDSAALATRAFRSFRFQPALRDGDPVAVWIVHKIHFEFEESSPW